MFSTTKGQKSDDGYYLENKLLELPFIKSSDFLAITNKNGVRVYDNLSKSDLTQETMYDPNKQKTKLETISFHAIQFFKYSNYSDYQEILLNVDYEPWLIDCHDVLQTAVYTLGKALSKVLTETGYIYTLKKSDSNSGIPLPFVTL